MISNEKELCERKYRKNYTIDQLKELWGLYDKLNDPLADVILKIINEKEAEERESLKKHYKEKYSFQQLSRMWQDKDQLLDDEYAQYQADIILEIIHEELEREYWEEIEKKKWDEYEKEWENDYLYQRM